MRSHISEIQAKFIFPLSIDFRLIIAIVVICLLAFVLYRQTRRLLPTGHLLSLLVAVLAAALLFSFAAGAVTVSSNPQVCGKTCHSMNPAFQSWRRSGHASVGCVSCHSKGSITDRLLAPLELTLTHIYKERTGRYSQPVQATDRAFVPDSTCRRCHAPPKRSKSSILIMDHEAHGDRVFNCVTCHNRTAHPEAQRHEPIRSSFPNLAFKDYMTMRQGCWRCHSKNGKFVDSSGKRYANYRSIAGRKPPADCPSCHPEYAMKKLTADILNVEKIHFTAKNWKRGSVHGERARRTRFRVCQTCHNPAKRCTVCHQAITMPHPNNWLVAHGGPAKTALREACRLCHDTVKAVPGCTSLGHHHERFVDDFKLNVKKAPWRSGKQNHGIAAKATGGRPCFRCHARATWCTTQCHQGITMPHGGDWRRDHYRTVGYSPGERGPTGFLRWDRSRAGACEMCHNPDGGNHDWCQGCHHKAFYQADPQLPRPWYESGMIRAGSKAGISLRLEGNVGNCVANCHSERLQFCIDCHQRFSD